MMPCCDMSQFGNEKKLSIQHYLIQMLHTILSLDKKETAELQFWSGIIYQKWCQTRFDSNISQLFQEQKNHRKMEKSSKFNLSH